MPYLIKKWTPEGLVPVETFDGDLNARIIELSRDRSLYMAEEIFEPIPEAPIGPPKKPRPTSAAKKKV